MALSYIQGSRKDVPTIYRATELALNVVPAKVRGVHVIHQGLIALSEDDRFSLKRITPEGLERARGAIVLLQSFGPEPIEAVLRRSLGWLQESARPIGLNPIEEINALKKVSEMGKASMRAVVYGVGAMALARILSEYPEERAASILAEFGIRTRLLTLRSIGR